MATRLRLPASGSPPVSPSFQSYSHSAATTRRNLPTSDASALGNVAQTPDGADHLVAGDTFHSQFVSDPLVAGIAFVTSDTVKYAIQCLEAHASNNLFVQLHIRVVDLAGTTQQAVLLTKSLDGTELPTSLNCRTASHALTSNYTTVLGDRLVVEFSLSGTPSASSGTQGHNGTLRWGGAGAGGDLAENESQTGTTLNPWIEFSRTLTFVKIVAIGQPSETDTAQPMVPTWNARVQGTGAPNVGAGGVSFVSDVTEGNTIIVKAGKYHPGSGDTVVGDCVKVSGTATLDTIELLGHKTHSEMRVGTWRAKVLSSGSLAMRCFNGLLPTQAQAEYLGDYDANDFDTLGVSDTTPDLPAVTTGGRGVIPGFIMVESGAMIDIEGHQTNGFAEVFGENDGTTTMPAAMADRAFLADDTQGVGWTGADGTPVAGVIVALLALASGLFATINQASETDTAQALARLKSKAIAQPSETDTAQATTSRKLKAIAQASETDSAQPVSARKVVTIGQATETDSAHPMTAPGPIVVALNQASETDSAQPFTHLKIAAVAQASETDTAQPLTSRKLHAIAQASETDTAQALTHEKARAIAQASETDTAQAFAHRKLKAIAQALETDTAQPMSSAGVHVVVIGQALETDTAHPMAVAPKHRLLNQVTETDTAQPLTHRKLRAIAQASESDTAQPLSHRKTVTITQVTETDFALVMAKAKRRGLAQVSELDTAQPIKWAPKIRIIGRAEEIDTALAMVAILGEGAPMTVLGRLELLDTTPVLEILDTTPMLRLLDTTPKAEARQ